MSKEASILERAVAILTRMQELRKKTVEDHLRGLAKLDAEIAEAEKLVSECRESVIIGREARGETFGFKDKS